LHRKSLYALLALAVAVFLLLLLRLRYQEDINDFLPDIPAGKRMTEVFRQMENADKIMIGFSRKDSLNGEDEITGAIDRFVAVLQDIDSLHIIRDIVSQVDESRMLRLSEFIRDNVPYYLTETDYRRMDSLLAADNTEASLLEDRRQLMLPSGSFLKQTILHDPLHLFSPLFQRMNHFKAGDGFEVRNGYLFSDNGKKGLVILTTPYGVSNTAQNSEPVELVNRSINRTLADFPSLRISAFGAPVIAVSNANRIKTDSLLAGSMAVFLIVFLLVLFFRSLTNLALIFLSVLFGWLFALGIFSVFKDHISLIALGAGSIFVGIAVNYPLHFIDHLQRRPDRKQALKEIIPPLLTGNISTVGAFISLLFIHSDAMRDLGLFGSLLLAGTILFVLIFLPHLVKTGHRGKPFPFGKWITFAPERKKSVLFSVIVITAVLFYFSRFTSFEPDMNKINYMTETQREDMRGLLDAMNRKDYETLYLVSEGKHLDDALAVYENNRIWLDSLVRAGRVENVSGAGNFLMSRKEQAERIKRWNGFRTQRGAELTRKVREAGVKAGFKPDAFAPFEKLLSTDFQVRETAWFEPVISFLRKNYLLENDNNTKIISLLYCKKEQKEALADLLAGKTSANGDTFYFDSRNMAARMVDALSEDFNYLLCICSLIVFAFLTFSFGRIELSLTAFLPLTMAWIWILGLMQLGGLSFNIVNIILASFIFGQGDDYTIFVTEGLMYEYAYRRKMLASYKNSIILSALLMFAGIGALIFAKHPAMRSLAEVTMIGMVVVVLMACIVPPSVFRWLTTKKGKYREVPLTLKRFALTAYAFTAFLLGCMMITCYGFLLFASGKKTEGKKRRYHALLRWVAGFVVKRIPCVRFNAENPAGETFEKPAVIICNHQSHLDLMCVMMLTPKLIILTNDWAWNSPFYGRLIKYADFYPVSGGIENSVERLAEKAGAGYSIAVFPEGTRSADCSIGRFHRGAFYLAETLRMDIVPVVLHGAGHVLPKNDFLLREGMITVQVHRRITPDDSRFAADYATRSRQVRQYYGGLLAALSRRLETAAYFKSFVMHNYLYKGTDIYRGAKKEMSDLERGKGSKKRADIDHYRGKGNVWVKNSGYGVFGFLFALVHKDTRVYATEEDDGLRALAQHCAGRPDNLVVCRENELPAGIKWEKTYG
jgi:1-acyl-sn-glycerol-3-phosphate acyltransferase